jgi:hypothetical protein
MSRLLIKRNKAAATLLFCFSMHFVVIDFRSMIIVIGKADILLFVRKSTLKTGVLFLMNLIRTS